MRAQVAYLARVYTDVFETGRRSKPASPASEVQQALLPPRIARLSGASLAGNVLPSYGVGGDWFDYVYNPDGSWLGIADAAGTGPAAALAAIALGAFRSARRDHADLHQSVQAMHDTISEVGGADISVAVTIARWHGASSTFSWINCATPRPMLIDTGGALKTLGESSAPLGTPALQRFEVERLRLLPGERIVLASDGVIARATQTGGELGADGIRAAAAGAPPSSAASTLKAIEDAVLGATDHPLDDDATLLVLAPIQAPTA